MRLLFPRAGVFLFINEKLMFKTFQTYFLDLIDLIFPQLCVACSHRPPVKEDVMCLFCKAQVAESEDYLSLENSFTQHFWGRVQIETGSSLFYYNKGGKVQTAIQKLKYKNKREIGIALGRAFGKKLSNAPLYTGINLIVPVPLHYKKERKRGYNQSDLFAIGLSESMNIPWSKKHLIRIKHTDTQTNKSRNERIDNVFSAFDIKHLKDIENKHILIVDDVLTTGATLEACAHEILKIRGTKVSFVTIAMGAMV